MHKQIRMTEELNSKLKDMEETMAASKQDSAILNEKVSRFSFKKYMDQRGRESLSCFS